MLHRGQSGPDLVHQVRVVVIGDHRLNAGVIDNVLMVLGNQTVVQWDQDQPQLAGGIKALQEKVGVGAQHADPIALLQT